MEDEEMLMSQRIRLTIDTLLRQAEESVGSFSDVVSLKDDHLLRQEHVVRFQAIVVDTAWNAGCIPSDGMSARLLFVVDDRRNFSPEDVKDLYGYVADRG